MPRECSCRVDLPWRDGEIPADAMERIEKEKLVVLADDSISVRKFVGRMLEKAGYRVKLASDGLEALEIATSNEMRPGDHRPGDAAHQWL